MYDAATPYLDGKPYYLKDKNDFKNYRQLQQELAELITAEAKSKLDMDYFQFQFDELEQAALKTGEQEQLQQELETLSNAQEIKLKLSHSLAMLRDGEINVITQMDLISGQLGSMARYNNEINLLGNRLRSTLIEIKDIADELESRELTITADNERIGVVMKDLIIFFICSRNIA